MQERIRTRATGTLSAVELWGNSNGINVGPAKSNCDNMKIMRVRTNTFARNKHIYFAVKSCAKAATILWPSLFDFPI